MSNKNKNDARASVCEVWNIANLKWTSNWYWEFPSVLRMFICGQMFARKMHSRSAGYTSSPICSQSLVSGTLVLSSAAFTPMCRKRCVRFSMTNAHTFHRFGWVFVMRKCFSCLTFALTRSWTTLLMPIPSRITARMVAMKINWTCKRCVSKLHTYDLMPTS